MGQRHRVLSFMSGFSNRDSRSPTPGVPQSKLQDPYAHEPPVNVSQRPQPVGPTYQRQPADSPPRAQRERVTSRPMSMVQTYQPPLMELTQDTLPELQPIFTFLNSHGNKLYQEGYFLKLDDQNTQGKPNADRTWTECFAQLVGTILSLWDAAELDAAGQDGEVLPKFINLTDASIKMIESLPIRSNNEPPLQNVLSISTAGKNRYLLHFNSHHSMIQWTAGIRLAIFEYTTLQEAYTGALIAGKGKFLNNINLIMERSKFPTADWARVRFGAGTPWRRCWCVITPPDEKEYQKLQKQMNKKKSAYARSTPPALKGTVKFYETKKTKKVKPIATITNAYSAFAIYPQSKPLIDASTLVKVEGNITINTNPETTTEGFVFVMPEVHPAVTGFEMMLRWLFPVWDTFNLYGRPGRLVADTTDVRSLMFAMPKQRRYGYLETLDVAGLILEAGSSNWKESEWRSRMKDLTAKRMTAVDNGSQPNSRYNSRRSTRNSFGPSRTRIQFDDGVSVKSTQSAVWGRAQPGDANYGENSRIESAPPQSTYPAAPPPAHYRSVSESQGMDGYMDPNSGYDGAYDQPPIPPAHGIGFVREGSNLKYSTDVTADRVADRVSSEDEHPSRSTPVRELEELQTPRPPQPVVAPPAFAHPPGAMPASKPYHSPELRRANSRISTTTLKQMAVAGGLTRDLEASINRGEMGEGPYSEDRGQRGVLSDAKMMSSSANRDGVNEGLVGYNRQYAYEDSTPSDAPAHDDNIFQHPRQSQSQYQTYSSYPENSHTSQAEYGQPSSQSFPIRQPNQQSYNPRQSFTPQPSTDSSRHTPQPPKLQTGGISRKPLPNRTSMHVDASASETASSAGSLTQHIDPAALALVHQMSTLGSVPQITRQDSESSVYEDTASTDTPDYESIKKPSFEIRRPVDKPRTGILKTVGADEPKDPNDVDVSADLIDIDFGPTFNLASGRQSPGPGVALHGHGRNKSASPAGHSRSPSRNMMTPELSHRRNDSTSSRTMAWQPGMGAIGNAGGGKGPAMTVEEFVQQRAAASPQYAHPKQQSGNTARGPSPRANTPTPFSHSRNNSTDLLRSRSNSTDLMRSRSNSGDLLQRPGSRDAATTLGAWSSGEYASRLSAREQEHIARVTGQPLVSLPSNPTQPVSPSSGLVGAIGNRERDREQMNRGFNSQAVEHAIEMRRQELLAQQYHDQQFAASSPQLLSQHQRQQSWAPSNMSAFGADNGWSTPGYSPGLEGGQQQYFGGQYQQQQGYGHNQGRGNRHSYYGQGY
ncbi:hypothetical protein F5884DRAFT_851818 [Xylogone sp. PMI_703]|nr:hypothetical protein F5884DRAFT_851818 [Xylogone sp. PMI_703]